MSTHIMIDLETLAVDPSATIVTLGAVKFNPWGNGYGDTMYLKFDLEEQETLGRTVDENTVEWWSRQKQEIIDETFDETGRCSVDEGIDQFHKFAWNCDCFWSHGSIFDIVIINDLYRQLEKTPPWQYWQIRDTRTIFDLGYDPDMPTNSKHSALQDAIRQAVGVQNIFRKLNIRVK